MSGRVNIETYYDDAGHKIEERFVDDSENLVLTEKGMQRSLMTTIKKFLSLKHTILRLSMNQS